MEPEFSPLNQNYTLVLNYESYDLMHTVVFDCYACVRLRELLPFFFNKESDDKLTKKINSWMLRNLEMDFMDFR